MCIFFVILRGFTTVIKDIEADEATVDCKVVWVDKDDFEVDALELDVIVELGATVVRHIWLESGVGQMPPQEASQ